MMKNVNLIRPVVSNEQKCRTQEESLVLLYAEDLEDDLKYK